MAKCRQCPLAPELLLQITALGIKYWQSAGQPPLPELRILLTTLRVKLMNPVHSDAAKLVVSPHKLLRPAAGRAWPPRLEPQYWYVYKYISRLYVRNMYAQSYAYMNWYRCMLAYSVLVYVRPAVNPQPGFRRETRRDVRS